MIRDDSLSSTINPQMFAKDHNSGNMETTCLRSKFVEHVYTLSTSSPIGNFNSQPSNSMVHLDSQASAQKHRAALEEMVEIFHDLPRTAIHDCVCACVPPKGQNQLYELSGAGASCRNLGKGAGRDQWWCSIAHFVGPESVKSRLGQANHISEFLKLNGAAVHRSVFHLQYNNTGCISCSDFLHSQM